ncbi:bifunctional 3,4-dihydroxy-2-butanone-4-phosphate synthase/GTP cyclohydrolase II [Chromobacterium paludis]
MVTWRSSANTGRWICCPRRTGEATKEEAMAISPIQDIIADIQAGKMVVLMDAEDRENEGDLVMAAEFVTPEAINFMAKHGRGLICLTLSEARCKLLNLPMMATNNGTSFGTNFTVSIEAAEGVTTGISAADRALTIKTAVARLAKASDLVQPGHVFPLKAQNGGVLVRAGHTEAGCDLAMLAGVEPAGVICEIMNDDGTMARLPELLQFAEAHGLKIGTIADLIQYRSRTESLVEKVGEREVDTPFGSFDLHVFRDITTSATHLALSKGKIRADRDTLVRVHEPLSVIDMLAPLCSHHSWTLPNALETIEEEGCGVVVLLYRDETGADLAQRALGQEAPRQKWDSKTFGIGAQMLKALGVGKMKLMSSPLSLPSMTGFELEVTGFCQPHHFHVDGEGGPGVA